MPSNIEIKARVSDMPALKEAVEAVADSDCVVLEQEDVFFRTTTGRLKLRILAPNHGELIFYERADSHGPKQSHYLICATSTPHQLRIVLCKALGERIVVRKRRSLYLAGQTRIHLDEVENLGTFMELEVVLRPDQDAAEGQTIAQELMARLGIACSELVHCAYADLLEKNAAPGKDKVY